MGSEQDLRHAISLRPSPFHHYPYDYGNRSESRSHSPRPESIPIPGTPDVYTSPSKHAATSTGVEPTTPTDEDHDPIARHHVPELSSEAGPADVERQSLPAYTRENDPYKLAESLKSADEIERIRANSSRKRADNGITAPLYKGKDAWQARKLQTFYEEQNENIERLLKPVDDHRREAKEQQGDDQLKYKIAVNGSFAANVVLAGLQLYGAASSGSLSLFTTMADALFDPLSNVTLMLCNRAVNRVDPRKFPSGKARIETAGNIVFCFLMCAVSAIIIVMSIRDLVAGSATLTNDFHLPAVIAVAVAFTTKLVLFFYCWSLRNTYSQIRILWEDHRNDLIINGFGILTSVLGSKLRWWIDPMGAVVLSCVIIFLWLRTAWSEFQLLIGVTADTHMLQLITYISMTHSPHIQSLDTVRAYHSGPRLIVEVDIVMDPGETLRATHDVAEELQTKLESLPNVERAYVHVDFETSHAPEHFWKKEL
ncbi:cation diffusion facilitator 1 [Aulographum hederae CBS 113979]|uniref:Cation diffusion facilitator 1 n=1 Tax=Aulographum hederae CBS 113979 TaxID=1176131 RepID=A0A6G1H163_9PEZI|nr:cation diffusion facilitator 1 [Aulographum hederae CBS 113979]